MVLTKAAKALLPQILVGVRYARAGVVLTDLCPAAMQPEFEPFVSAHEQKQIGSLVEQIRREHGVKSIGLGLAGLQEGPAWEMKREMRSPRYTQRIGLKC